MGQSGDELRTGRLVLRPFGSDDVEELVAVFRDPAVRRYLLDDTMVSVEWVREEVEASAVRFKDSGTGLWTVRLLGQFEIIGFGGFREFFTPPQLQLLYGLLPGYWGRGFATEVARRICEYAFEGLGHSEVTAAIDVPNEPSQRVLERLGMRLDRTEQEGAGTAFYVLRRDSWRAGSRHGRVDRDR